jgi:hypothetical protein
LSGTTGFKTGYTLMHDGGTVLNPEVFQGKTNIISGNPVFNSRIPRRFGITHGSIPKNR